MIEPLTIIMLALVSMILVMMLADIRRLRLRIEELEKEINLLWNSFRGL